jgi:hypothetical protein
MNISTVRAAFRTARSICDSSRGAGHKSTHRSDCCFLSSHGYNLLWLNCGKCELNPPSQWVTLQKVDVAAQGQVVDVTTGSTIARQARTEAIFETQIHLNAT